MLLPMPRLLLLVLGALGLAGAITPAAHAQPICKDTHFQAIPSALVEAPAVVRLSSTRFEVDRQDRARLYVRKAVTVYGPAGREFGQLQVYYDPFRSVERLVGCIRDASGEVVQKLGRDDVEDYAAASSNLYDGYRVRVAQLHHGRYPYTVEFAYEVERNGLVGWPSWYPQQPGEQTYPVERSTFEVSLPAAMPVRYALRDLDQEPLVSESEGRKTLRWHASGLAGRDEEVLAPPAADLLPHVDVATGPFAFDGKPGNMGSWTSFAAWYAELSEGRDRLPAAAVAEVARVAAGLTDRQDIARAVYAYLQETTRYVSVQLGLGGWQTLPADAVFENRYGDCKALTNYLGAMLRVAGVPSYPVLIRAGDSRLDLDPDFPDNVFNHVILFVPLDDAAPLGEGDGIWLEATSQSAPFGVLGSFTEGRYGLLVSPQGGRLVRTPEPAPEAAQRTRRADVRLLSGGSATASVQATYRGARASRFRSIVSDLGPMDQQEWAEGEIGMAGLQPTAFDLDLEREEPTWAADLSVRRFATRAGTRLLVRPAFWSEAAWSLPEVAERQSPVVLPVGSEVDTVRTVPPAGFAVEGMPEPIALETPFARYTRETTVQPDGALRWARRLDILRSRLEPEEYDDVRRFFDAVVRADADVAVLAPAR